MIVTRFKNRIEAELAGGLLATEGMSSLVSADDAGGMRPFPVSYQMGVDLKVEDKHLVQAKKILKVK